MCLEEGKHNSTAMLTLKSVNQTRTLWNSVVKFRANLYLLESTSKVIAPMTLSLTKMRIVETIKQAYASTAST